jgi:hypothetical protein
MYTTTSFANHPVGILAGDSFYTLLVQELNYYNHYFIFGKIPVGVYRKNELIPVTTFCVKPPPPQNSTGSIKQPTKLTICG